MPTPDRLPPWEPGGGGGDGLRIGVVDTGLVAEPGPGVDWLAGRVEVRATDPDQPEIDRDPPAADDADARRDQHGHGTFVSGIILNEAPQSRILMRRGLLAFGNDRVEDSTVANAIRDLVAAGVDLINLSFDGVDKADETGPPEQIRAALVEAAGNGILIVAAGGNSPTGETVYPGSFADPSLPGNEEISGYLVAVGAADETVPIEGAAAPVRAGFSNHGSWIRATANGVDVLGPFVVRTFTDQPNGPDPGVSQRFDGWARASGTSFAAATVTGVIARNAHLTGRSPLAVATAWGLVGDPPPADPVYVQGRNFWGAAHPVAERR